MRMPATQSESTSVRMASSTWMPSADGCPACRRIRRCGSSGETGAGVVREHVHVAGEDDQVVDPLGVHQLQQPCLLGRLARRRHRQVVEGQSEGGHEITKVLVDGERLDVATLSLDPRGDRGHLPGCAAADRAKRVAPRVARRGRHVWTWCSIGSRVVRGRTVGQVPTTACTGCDLGLPDAAWGSGSLAIRVQDHMGVRTGAMHRRPGCTAGRVDLAVG